jgi:hypothetical protein
VETGIYNRKLWKRGFTIESCGNRGLQLRVVETGLYNRDLWKQGFTIESCGNRDL